MALLGATHWSSVGEGATEMVKPCGCSIGFDHAAEAATPRRPLRRYGMEQNERAGATDTPHDPVDHPQHYALAPGVEVIDLTEQLDFLRGNAVKYLARAGRKDGADELEDLRKAAWYANRAVAKLEAERA